MSVFLQNGLRWAAVFFGLAALLNLAALLAGSAPLDVYLQLAHTTFTPYGLAQICFRATPLILLGTALCLSGRAGVLNIGAEGQLIVAALAVGALAPYLPNVGAFVFVLGLVGAVSGGAFAGVAAWLREKMRAPEVMTTIMLNFVAAAIANYCIHFLAPSESTHTLPMPDALRFTRLAQSTGSPLSTAFVYALLIAIAAEFFLFRTRSGFALRSYGQNPRAAALYGVPKAVPALAFIASGALAGLCALHYVSARGFHEDGFSGGVGFTGLAVALLAAERPIWVIPAAFVFALLSHAALAINSLVPKEIAEVLTAAIMIAALAVARGKKA